MFPPSAAPPLSGHTLAELPAASLGGTIQLCVVHSRAPNLVHSLLSAKALAGAVSRCGAQVTLLDCTSGGPAEESDGIERVTLGSVYRLGTPYMPVRALCAHDWLKRRAFDAVVFLGGFGVGHYAVAAKRLGLAYDRTVLWALLDRPHAWALYQSEEFPEGRTDIERDYIERRTAEGADALVADPAIAAWCVAAGWQLPATAFAHPEADLAGRILAATQAMDWKPVPIPMEKPLVSVCMPTFNRAEMLAEAIASVERQTYQAVELVLVDDGSTDPAARALIDSLAERFAPRGWQLLKQKNSGPSAARMRAAAAARGSFLLFMDDDNVALCHEIETLVGAAQYSGADIVTCIPGLHASSNKGAGGVTSLQTADPAIPQIEVDWTPVGPCLPLSVYVSCCGDNNALFRRSVFEELGGYRGAPSQVMEDVELLTRAMIAGAKIEVVPEVLFQYRKHQGSRSLASGLFESHLHALEPLLAMVPAALRPILLAARDAWYERHRRAADSDAD